MKATVATAHGDFSNTPTLEKPADREDAKAKALGRVNIGESNRGDGGVGSAGMKHQNLELFTQRTLVLRDDPDSRFKKLRGILFSSYFHSTVVAQ